MDEYCKKIIVSTLLKVVETHVLKITNETSISKAEHTSDAQENSWIKNNAPYMMSDKNEKDQMALNCFAIITEAENLIKSNQDKTVSAEQESSTSVMLANIFNSVVLGNIKKAENLYFKPEKIGVEIPCPQPLTDHSTSNINTLWQEFKQDLHKTGEHFSINTLLMLIEKYFSFVPYSNSLNSFSDVSVFQQAKLSAAIASNIFNSLFDKNDKIQEWNSITDRSLNRHLLIGGDISGVQDFIYTIASTGALKSLRGRSFYLEMLTEKIVKDIIQALDISSANIIFSGGGGFYILAQNTENSQKQIQTIKNSINKWILAEFAAKLYFNIEFTEFKGSDITEVLDSEKEYSFASVWKQLSWKIEMSKNKKFNAFFNDIFKIKMPQNLNGACPVCHTDEKSLDGRIKDLKTCSLCSDLSNISNRILQSEKYRFLYESDSNGDFCIQNRSYKFAEKQAIGRHNYIINSWDIDDWKGIDGSQLLVGNYGSGCKELEELSKRGEGKNFIGALRMDVDNLGSIFIQGLSVKSITRMAELSRRLTLFFKYYINFICKGMIPKKDIHLIDSKAATNLRDVEIIYSGGDDLFILGAWNQTAEIAFDIRKVFNNYTGNNPCVTLSAGITLHRHNYPVYQIAQMSKEAEHEAKSNDNGKSGAEKSEKNSISLFYSDTWKRKNEFLCNRMKKRIKWDIGPSPEKIISQAEFWDDAEKDIFNKTADLYNAIDWSKVSHGFFRKLFNIIEIWQRDGVLFMPSLHYLINQSKKELGSSSACFLSSIQTEFMPNLLIPLTWIEYMNRKEG